ncbi:hypothetical protein [Rhizobium sp. S96]|uniref:hypothetical protein n=1 Tax=Rhizobium sp. S96 TaxID=3055140 RepID=UPI0025AB56D6|nr:hypothetical protein [Rhizobium sp. S96]MDM9621868.1 hypothetical protein [Rhizobium sp. S96]
MRPAARGGTLLSSGTSNPLTWDGARIKEFSDPMRRLMGIEQGRRSERVDAFCLVQLLLPANEDDPPQSRRKLRQ